MKQYKIDIPGDLQFLHLATNFTSKVCSFLLGKKGCDFIQDIELCVSEACTNAIKYGCPDGTKDSVMLKFKVFPDKLIIQIKEKGKGFKLEEIPKPRPEDYPERGYGVYIIKEKMDKVEYIRTQRGNILQMTKCILTSLYH